MSVMDKLFSFNGRLRRRDWWLFVILLGIVSAILSGVAMNLMGVSIMALFPMGGAAPGDVSATVTKVFEIQCVVFLLFLWPGVALGVKRLHDRERPGWLLVVFYVMQLANQAVTFMTARAGVGMMQPNPVRSIVSLLALAVGVWMLIELGFLDGTQGPNKYGPSPKGLGAEEVGFST